MIVLEVRLCELGIALKVHRRERRLFLNQEPLRFKQHVHALGKVRLCLSLIDQLVVPLVTEVCLK
jgi:hypothetical protein